MWSFQFDDLYVMWFIILFTIMLNYDWVLQHNRERVTNACVNINCDQHHLYLYRNHDHEIIYLNIIQWFIDLSETREYLRHQNVYKNKKKKQKKWNKKTHQVEVNNMECWFMFYFMNWIEFNLVFFFVKRFYFEEIQVLTRILWKKQTTWN